MRKNFIIFILILISVSLFTILFNQKNIQFNQNSEIGNKDTADKSLAENIFQNLGSVDNVNSLDLSGRNLDKLPYYVLSYTGLEELDLSNNSISEALPAEIRLLQNLKVLDASNNKMTGVPAEIGQLSKLEILNLSNNQLTGLPYELGNLKNLKILNLSGNDYSQQDLEIIKKGLPKQVEIIL